MNKLCVITICFNDLTGLKKTIESLKSQTQYSFDQIIVDGGSTDGTREYLSELKLPWIFRWSSEKDRGIYDAMNKGLGKATAEFIWFLNSGDTCATPTVVEQIFPHMNDDVDLIYGKAWYVGAFGKKSVGKPVSAKDFRRGMPICHQSILYRTSLARTQPYPLDYRIISDWIVTQSLFQKTARQKFLDLYIANFDLSGVSAQNHFKVLKEKLRSEPRLVPRLEALLFLGGKFGFIWLLKKMRLYRFYKSWQSA